MLPPLPPRLLPPGEYARFQPLSRTFHTAVGDHMKPVLEQCLLTHCTLTEGDVIQVAVGEPCDVYDLKVLELRPATAVSIMDTDMEADVVRARGKGGMVCCGSRLAGWDLCMHI